MIKQRGNIISALDIGGSKILCVVSKIATNNQLEVLGHGTHLANGIRSGIITDLQAAAESISNAVSAAEQASGVRIGNVYTNIASGSLIAHQLTAEIDVTGHEINSKDLSKLLFQVADRYKDQNVNIVHSFVYDYILDGNRGIINPLGMYGNILSCEINVLVSPCNVITNLSNCLAKCQLDVSGYVASSYAAGVACLSHEEMKIGCTLIEIGSSSAAVSIFANGQMIFTDGIPLGGHHITSDIAKGLGITYEQAEWIKILYGTAVDTSVDCKGMIEIDNENGDEERSTVSKAILAEIIKARAEEILELLERKATNSGFSIAGNKIIITGGSANLNGLKDMMTQMFSAKVKIGNIASINGLQENEKNSSFVTAAGILQHVLNIRKSQNKKHSNISTSSKLLQWIKDNFSN